MIRSHSECRAAVKKLGYKRRPDKDGGDYVVDHYNLIPSGCSINLDDECLHFEKNSLGDSGLGKGRSDPFSMTIVPICRGDHLAPMGNLYKSCHLKVQNFIS